MNDIDLNLITIQDLVKILHIKTQDYFLFCVENGVWVRASEGDASKIMSHMICYMDNYCTLNNRDLNDVIDIIRKSPMNSQPMNSQYECIWKNYLIKENKQK